MKETKQSNLAHVFYALSDDIRLKIIRLISDGELCVCDIMAALDMGQSRVSFHMGVLKAAGLVSSRRFGRWNSYRMATGKKMLAGLNDLVQNNRSVSITEEKKRLKIYLKEKQRFAQDGKCCPELPGIFKPQK